MVYTEVEKYMLYPNFDILKTQFTLKYHGLNRFVGVLIRYSPQAIKTREYF